MLTCTEAGAAVEEARRLRRDVWRNYALGVAAQATVLTVATFVAAGIEFRPFRSAIVWVIYVWPLVFLVAVLSAFDRRTMIRAVLLYTTVLLILAGLAGNLAGGPLLWLLIDGPTTALVLLHLHRSVRAVGVLIVLFVYIGLFSSQWLVGFIGGSDERIATVATIASQLGGGGVLAVVALVAIGFVVAAVVGWFVLRRLGRACRHGLPDQLVLAAAISAVFAILQGVPLAFEDPVWALAPPAAFAAF